MMSISYEVILEDYTERHYIKRLRKKYKGLWETTLLALQREFQSFDVILERSIAEAITDKQADPVICKTEFRISGTQDSRHASGLRCIVAQHKREAQIRVLLVYHKSDLGEGNETAKWKSLIRMQFPEYRNVLEGGETRAEER